MAGPHGRLPADHCSAPPWLQGASSCTCPGRLYITVLHCTAPRQHLLPGTLHSHQHSTLQCTDAHSQPRWSALALILRYPALQGTLRCIDTDVQLFSVQTRLLCPLSGGAGRRSLHLRSQPQALSPALRCGQWSRRCPRAPAGRGHQDLHRGRLPVLETRQDSGCQRQLQVGGRQAAAGAACHGRQCLPTLQPSGDPKRVPRSVPAACGPVGAGALHKHSREHAVCECRQGKRAEGKGEGLSCKLPLLACWRWVPDAHLLCKRDLVSAQHHPADSAALRNRSRCPAPRLFTPSGWPLRCASCFSNAAELEGASALLPHSVHPLCRPCRCIPTPSRRPRLAGT